MLAATLLFWGLSEKYLWQDEANTAVLATRLLRFGSPLAYDGVNLVTIDDFSAEDDSIRTRSAAPKPAIDYYVHRGDLRANTAWKYHPWGQFVLAAASIKLLGQTTLAARLPFALAGLLTGAALYLLVRNYCRGDAMASIAVALLAFNAFWILHSRQCRYYALSSLFLLLTLLSYARWQRAARFGAAIFVATAWLYFQVDYGTVWPVLAVLAIDCLVAQRKNLLRPALAGAALGILIAPFFVYYGLWGRAANHQATWAYRFWFNLFNMNQYIVPALVFAAALALLIWRWRSFPVPERRLVAMSCGIISALAVWVPSVAPDAYLRYIIMAAPIGCLLSAWVLVRAAGERTVYAVLGALVLAGTPWLSLPLRAIHTPAYWARSNAALANQAFRQELVTLYKEVFAPPPDPNRLVVDWLKQNTAPSDEILINYEDVPLMYYLPNPIRGGIAAFRAEDDSKSPPSVLVIRKTIPFVYWRVYARETNRHHWEVAPLKAPDVIWGNNPDPRSVAQDFATTNTIVVARRVEHATGRGVVFGDVKDMK